MGEQTIIPVGALVQIKESALAEDALHGLSNQQTVADHGWLWIVEVFLDDEEVYLCRSLATGEDGGFWYHDEITAAPTEENTHG